MGWSLCLIRNIQSQPFRSFSVYRLKAFRDQVFLARACGSFCFVYTFWTTLRFGLSRREFLPDGAALGYPGQREYANMAA